MAIYRRVRSEKKYFFALIPWCTDKYSIPTFNTHFIFSECSDLSEILHTTSQGTEKNINLANGVRSNINTTKCITENYFSAQVNSKYFLSIHFLLASYNVNTVEPLQTWTPKTRNPSKPNKFVSPKFLSSYLNLAL